MVTTGLSTFQQLYELSPIFLVGGVAGSGEPIPITQILQNGVTPNGPNDYFAHFKPLPGGTIESWGVAQYPLAALTTAANAVVQQPISISLLMQCPAQNAAGNNYYNKLSIISSLKSTLDNHILQGGWFSVYTPAFVYSGCLLTSLKDVSGAENKQVQLMYQWDFVQPLITEEQAATTQTAFMNKVTQGFKVIGQPAYSGGQ